MYKHNFPKSNPLKAASSNTMGHWESSQLPYFAVLQESHNGEVINSYPEMRYVFKDDPLYDSIGESIDEDTEAIVVTLDEDGNQIRGCRSLSDDLGVVDISIKDKDSTKTLAIEVTRSTTSDGEYVATKDLASLKQMVELFQQRNEQLRQVINND